MEVADILRVCIILVGFALLCITVTSLAKRRMTETFCIIWGGISFLVILAGLLLRPVLLKNYISTAGMVILSMVAFCFICGAYFLSTMISDLTRKNRELAIQVSLLKRECEKNKERLDKMEGNTSDEENTYHY